MPRLREDKRGWVCGADSDQVACAVVAACNEARGGSFDCGFDEVCVCVCVNPYPPASHTSSSEGGDCGCG